MRSRPHSWIRLIGSLGLRREKHSDPLSSGHSRKLCFEQCEDRRMLTVFTVMNTEDAPENTPAAVGTLRQAIFDANQLDDSDTIARSCDTPREVEYSTADRRVA
jgi:hypothetical protein